MKGTPLYHPKVLDDLDEVEAYIGADNPERALSFVQELLQKCLFLGENPRAGHGRPDLKAGIRAHPVQGYIILYHVIDGGQTRILRIVHGSRDLKALLKSFSL